MPGKTRSKKELLEDDTYIENTLTDEARRVMRWPLCLPSGDTREIQINDITRDNPYYPYKLIPGAGTIYGGDILRARMGHLTNIIQNYVPFLKDLTNERLPETMSIDALPTDKSGLALLQCEYENYRKKNGVLDQSKSDESSEKDILKPTAGQLIFGFDEPEYKWIREDLSLQNGNLLAIRENSTTYYVWLGKGKHNLYREYRIDEKWVWNSYNSDLQTAEEEAVSARKFFHYAVTKGDNAEEWKMVQESSFPAVDSLFCVFASNPKRGMTLFADYNFQNNRKWHRYKILDMHPHWEPNILSTISVSNFEDDVEMNWTALMETVVEGLSNLSVREQNEIATATNTSWGQILERQKAMKVVNGYKQLTDHCKANAVDMTDLETLETIEEFRNFKSLVKGFVPTFDGVRMLYLAATDDCYILLSKVDAFAKILELNKTQVSDKLQSLMKECQKLLDHLVNSANVFEFRKVAYDSNRDMLARFLMACLDTGTKLSPIERATLPAMSSVSLGTAEVVHNFADHIQELIEFPNLDPSLPLKEVLRKMQNIFRQVDQVYEELRAKTLEEGFKEFENTIVYNSNKKL